jgi:chemotaxis signal transduction protein
MGKARLLFPAAELLAMEPVSSMKPPPAGDRFSGAIVTRGMTVPVVTVDEDLQPVRSCEVRRRFCIVLRNEQEILGLTCDEANVIETGDMQFHDLPGCMRTEDAIIPMIAVHNGSLFSVCKTAHLLRALNHSTAAPTQGKTTLGLKK